MIRVNHFFKKETDREKPNIKDILSFANEFVADSKRFICLEDDRSYHLLATVPFLTHFYQVFERIPNIFIQGIGDGTGLTAGKEQKDCKLVTLHFDKKDKLIGIIIVIIAEKREKDAYSYFSGSESFGSKRVP
jgi:hypothetical protein